MTCTPLFLALLSLVACEPNRPDKTDTDGDTSTDTGSLPDGTGTLTITTPSGEQDGDILFTITAAHPDSLAAPLEFEYTLDSATWSAASMVDAPITVNSTPDGVETDVTWDSYTDLGEEDENVALRVFVAGQEEVWAGAVTDVFTVSNGDDPPEVNVYTPEATLPSGAVDGMVLFQFDVIDDGDDVEATIEYNAGAGWTEATAGPGSPSLANLAPGYIDWTWDSVEDLGQTDGVVKLRVTIDDRKNPTVSAETDTFKVENEPTPDAGELVFSELMPFDDELCKYIEIVNLTHHVLTLEGLVISDATGDSTPVVAFDDLDPGAYAVFTTDPQTFDDVSLSYNGEVEGIWSRNSDTLTLSSPNGEVFSLSYNDTGWPYDQGVSMQLDPTVTDATAAVEVESWCASTSPVASDVVDLGTPGWENTACGGEVPGDYIEPYYFMPNVQFGLRDGSPFAEYTYGGAPLGNYMWVTIAPEEYYGSWDDTLLCDIYYDLDLVAASLSGGDFPIDLETAALGAAETTCLFDPAGPDWIGAFAGAWGFVAGEIVDAEIKAMIEDAGYDAGDFLGGDMYWDGASFGEMAGVDQVMYGYAMAVDGSGEIDDASVVTATDIAGGTDAFVQLYSMYLWGVSQ